MWLCSRAILSSTHKTLQIVLVNLLISILGRINVFSVEKLFNAAYICQFFSKLSYLYGNFRWLTPSSIGHCYIETATRRLVSSAIKYCLTQPQSSQWGAAESRGWLHSAQRGYRHTMAVVIKLFKMWTQNVIKKICWIFMRQWKCWPTYYFYHWHWWRPVSKSQVTFRFLTFVFS